MPSTSLLIAAPPPAQPAAPSTGRALAFVYAGYLFRYVYLLILIPFYGRVLGAQEYGRVLAAMSLYQMVWMITEYGFPLAGARDIAAAGNDTRRVGALYAQQMNARWLMAVPGLLLGAAGTLASPLLRETPLFGLLATANGLIAAFNLGWFYQGRLRFGTSVVFEMIGFAINLPLILLSVHGPGDGARVLGALLASTIVCTLAAHAYALRSIEPVRAGWRESLALVRSSTALFAHKGVTLMMASSSTYLLSLFAPAAQVGWYGAAERLAAVGLSLMQPANHVLVGTVASRIGARETRSQAYSLMRVSLLLMTAFGVLLLAGTWLLARPMVPLILGPEFMPTVPMLYVLALTFPLAAFGQVTSTYVLIPLRRDTLVSLSSLFGALATMVAILALAPLAGGLGVAWARCGGSVLLAAVLLAILVKQGLLQRIFR
jgi:PST family polysaccharide transporter